MSDMQWIDGMQWTPEEIERIRGHIISGAGVADPATVQPTQVETKAPLTDREKQVSRALTTVNRDDFSLKPAPKTAEAD